MATFTISKIKPATDKRREQAESLLNAAKYWGDLGMRYAIKAGELVESSQQHYNHSKQCLEEAAKLLGFKNADDMNVYIDKHGTI